jgi:hypothetical protein
MDKKYHFEHVFCCGCGELMNNGIFYPRNNQHFCESCSRLSDEELQSIIDKRSKKNAND